VCTCVCVFFVVLPDKERRVRIPGLRIFHILMVEEDVGLPLEEAGLLHCVGGISIDPALLMGMRLDRGCSSHLCRYNVNNRRAFASQPLTTYGSLLIDR